ncbi:MAG: hypothetical protein ACLTJ8_07580 [Veillonella atypica]
MATGIGQVGAYCAQQVQVVLAAEWRKPTTQNVASAINDAITKSKTDTAQAIADAEHKFDGYTVEYRQPLWSQTR